MRLRNEVGQIVLEVLGSKADRRNLVGQKLVRFSLEDLHQAVDGRLGLAQILGDEFSAIEKTLLFLDENHVIKLEKGLSVFRQAMTLKLQREARRKRYSERGIRPPPGTLRPEDDPDSRHRPLRPKNPKRAWRAGPAAMWTTTSGCLGRTSSGRYFPREMQSLKRPTSKEKYAEIVESLGNQAQEWIVKAPKNRNLLVLAGPGSGKTRVVVHRAAYLLMVERIRPERLLVICFNRSAMHELRVRLRELVGDLARRVAVHTYHSLALRLTERSLAERVRASGDNKIDFDRIIKEANGRLAGEEEIIGAEPDELRDRLLSGFEFVLVDEYQDIDADQYEMITHIARRAGLEGDDDRRATILAVGDDDQNIYEWRHASVRYLKRFEEDFKADRHYLVENYRSTGRIIDASNELIRHNRDRMKTHHPITINAGRSRDRPGGRWERLDPRLRGMVSRIEVESPGVPAIALAEIERLRKLDPESDGSTLPFLPGPTLNWRPSVPFLRRKESQCADPFLTGLPRLERIREFRWLLDRLTEDQNAEVSLARLRRELAGMCNARANGHHWMGMADQMLAELQAAVGVQPVVDIGCDRGRTTGIGRSQPVPPHRTRCAGQHDPLRKRTGVRPRPATRRPARDSRQWARSN